MMEIGLAVPFLPPVYTFHLIVNYGHYIIVFVINNLHLVTPLTYFFNKLFKLSILFSFNFSSDIFL